MSESLQQQPTVKDYILNDQDYKIHIDAMEKGGIKIIDEGGVMPAALKDIAKKVAKATMKGQVGDLMKIPAPAYVHHPLSHLNLTQNDCTFASYLM